MRRTKRSCRNPTRSLAPWFIQKNNLAAATCRSRAAAELIVRINPKPESHMKRHEGILPQRAQRAQRVQQPEVSQLFSVLPVNSVVRFPGPELGTFMVLHGLHVEILVRTSRCTRPAGRLSFLLNSCLASAPQSGELGR